MGAAIAKAFFKKGKDQFDTNYASLNEVMVNTLEGERKSIGNVTEGCDVYLVVNVASK